MRQKWVNFMDESGFAIKKKQMGVINVFVF